MRDHQDDFGYWLGWIIAFVMAAAFFVFAVLHGFSIKEAMCKPEEADCFRQWITALGGWATVVAAVPSIVYLGRQIKAADRQFRTNTALHLYRNRALARHIVLFSGFSTSHINEKLLETSGGFTLDHIRELVSYVEELVADARLEYFEREIETPHVSIFFIRQTLELFKKILVRAGEDERAEREALSKYEGVVEILLGYFVSTARIGNRYLKTTAPFAAEEVENVHPAKASST